MPSNLLWLDQNVLINTVASFKHLNYLGMFEVPIVYCALGTSIHLETTRLPCTAYWHTKCSKGLGVPTPIYEVPVNPADWYISFELLDIEWDFNLTGLFLLNIYWFLLVLFLLNPALKENSCWSCEWLCLWY